MVTIKNLHKSYKTGTQELKVLKGIDLTVSQGDFVSIMGPSGSGKSTLLNVLGILDNYNEGEYWLGDTLIKDLSQVQSAQYRNHYLGFVFQSFNLLPFKNAMENVALPLYYKGIKRKERNKIARDYLERVGLGDRWNHLPNELSGGQNQRVSIARALVGNPRLILADEPTGALDSNTSKEIISLFKEVNKEGMTIIIVTHDKEVANNTNRIIQLKDGLVQNV
ncbi:MAG: ABC transporter ATP-binding protein [Chitinophagales bacterium]|nr:ABC transporter ATP-binding protein [Bacteroidota bacterium]